MQVSLTNSISVQFENGIATISSFNKLTEVKLFQPAMLINNYIVIFKDYPVVIDLIKDKKHYIEVKDDPTNDFALEFPEKQILVMYSIDNIITIVDTTTRNIIGTIYREDKITI